MTIVGYLIVFDGRYRTRLKGPLEWVTELPKASIFSRSELDTIDHKIGVVFVPLYANIVRKDVNGVQ